MKRLIALFLLCPSVVLAQTTIDPSNPRVGLAAGIPACTASTQAVYVVLDPADSNDCETGEGSTDDVNFCRCNPITMTWQVYASTIPVSAGSITSMGQITAGLRTGDGEKLVTADDAGTSGVCLEWDANGNPVDAASGQPCGTAASLGSDVVGTNELDDDTDTPGLGDFARVSTSDTTKFQYDTPASIPATIGLVPGTDVQAQNAKLQDLVDNDDLPASVTSNGAPIALISDIPWSDLVTALVPPNNYNVIVGGDEDADCELNEICLLHADAAVTANVFSTNPSTTPGWTWQDADNSGRVNLAVSDGAGPDGVLTMQVDVGGVLTTMAEMNGITEVLNLFGVKIRLGANGAPCITIPDHSGTGETAVWVEDGVVLDEADTNGICADGT